MRKRTVCKEKTKIIYNIGQVTYCKLHCQLDLGDARTIPLELKFKICDKYKLTMSYTESPNFIIDIWISAKATCQQGDTFDEKKGKIIAYSKAQHKLYHLLVRIFKDISRYQYLRCIDAGRNASMFERYSNRESNFLSKL